VVLGVGGSNPLFHPSISPPACPAGFLFCSMFSPANTLARFRAQAKAQGEFVLFPRRLCFTICLALTPVVGVSRLPREMPLRLSHRGHSRLDRESTSFRHGFAPFTLFLLFTPSFMAGFVLLKFYFDKRLWMIFTIAPTMPTTDNIIFQKTLFFSSVFLCCSTFEFDLLLSPVCTLPI
jgi:hypothetical protein